MGFGDQIRRAASEQEKQRNRVDEENRRALQRREAELRKAEYLERIAMLIAEDLEHRGVPHEQMLVEHVEYKVRLFSSRTDFRYEAAGQGWRLRMWVGTGDSDMRRGPDVTGAILTSEGKVICFGSQLGEGAEGLSAVPYELIAHTISDPISHVLYSHDDEEAEFVRYGLPYSSLLQAPLLETDLAELAARHGVNPRLFD